MSELFRWSSHWMSCFFRKLKLFHEKRCRFWNCSLWWKRTDWWHIKLFPRLVTSNGLWLHKYLPGWGQQLLIFLSILMIVLVHQIASNNSILLGFLNVSLTISFWPTCFSHFQCNKLIHIRIFYSTACSESKCQIHYQFNCFALLNWAIASEATRLKFIVRKFMTWEFSCPGNKMMW